MKENTQEPLKAVGEASEVEHLQDLTLPDIALPATHGESVHLSRLPTLSVLYIYTMTGRPDMEMPHDWDIIPGAHGSTPESCNFRDLYPTFQANNTAVFGLSTQRSAFQQEAKVRLELPFELLSDYELNFGTELKLPYFKSIHAEAQHFHKRLTLVIKDGTIIKMFYPVTDPDHHAEEVVAWLELHVWQGTDEE